MIDRTELPDLIDEAIAELKRLKRFIERKIGYGFGVIPVDGEMELGGRTFGDTALIITKPDTNFATEVMVAGRWSFYWHNAGRN